MNLIRSSNNDDDTNSVVETIRVMRRQEDAAYLVTDYLSRIPSAATLEAPVDASCRHLMAKWCVEIADFCSYGRETAAVAVNCLDRFMATATGREILLDRGQYQLAAMTALYSAVKIHEHEAMDPALISTLSRGVHQPAAVEAMERKMLSAIQWRVNPPTSMSFVRNMMDVVPGHLIGPDERETVMELTNFQLDLAITDYKFSRAPASSLAFASLLNAVESVSSDSAFFASFESTMSGIIQIDHRCLRDVRIALYEAVNGTDSDAMDIQSYSADSTTENKTANHYSSPVDVHSSPRSVNA